MVLQTRYALSVGSAMPAVMGDGLKPLTTSHRPSDSSHKKIGTPAITVKAVTGWSPRKNAAMAEAMNRGAPMSPSTGMRRGRHPQLTALLAAAIPPADPADQFAALLSRILTGLLATTAQTPMP